MDEATFRLRAQQHLRAIALYFVVSLVIAAFSFEIRYWAERHETWQAEFVWFVFSLIGSLAALSALVFGVMVFSWIKSYNRALLEVRSPTYDREDFERMHRDVIGPIPWR